MTGVLAGSVTALYLFDVAEAIDLGALGSELGERVTAARLNDKSAGPSRARYLQPPLVVDGATFGCECIDDFRVRVKFYDYGVVSLMLSRTFSGSWDDLVGLGQTLIESERLEEQAAKACALIVASVRPRLRSIRTSFLTEDYLVFAVVPGDPPALADEVIAGHGREIAQLLRGERQALSAQETDRVLRHRLSYLADDLVVPAWNAAFVYDSEAAVRSAIEVFEYANSQLLEFRYHDDLLEDELTRLYADLEQPRWSDRFSGHRHTKAARHVQSLVIDVNELTDRTENAVKFIGDIYLARLFAAVAERLGLDRWKHNVNEQLRTLSEIHRFAVERTSTSHANLLELAIVFILVLDLGLFFAGVMQ